MLISARNEKNHETERYLKIRRSGPFRALLLVHHASECLALLDFEFNVILSIMIVNTISLEVIIEWNAG